MTAIAIFEIGSLVCATAPTSTALIVGRAVAGLGVGGLFSGAINILAFCSVGYYVPVQIVSMILFSIGSGLLTTFDLHTPLPKWFGYQVLAGSGIGVGFQASVLVVQTVLPLKDVPVATAMVSFFQSLGGALFIAVAQSLFQHGLTDNISRGAPELDPQIFLRSGATQIRSILAGLALFVCFGLEWKNIKKGDGQGTGKKAKDEESGREESVKEESLKEKPIAA
ncbi:putative HC-toxin efflux carrier TOXA [Glarea lozoyensis 74030]|uniref:Putative HC-toxin efflux carrier TOXA n=1 Tax=Glarea lozoyensis (strain ATCC 74030 / MF5533) TaxID=1104152 RepID=H0EPH4_GLAL7|nr:putative HC-toxin efflux carrier TOXA [Glarea lozoyensis 74030]